MNRKNLANGRLANPLGSGDTTATLVAGQGANMPSVPFRITISPENVLSTLSNSEICEVTAISTDTLTITRAQSGTTAKGFDANAVVANGVYVEDIDGKVAKSGDDMTGPLNLPNNGLTVGTDKLVVANSKVGVGGVANPATALDVNGSVSMLSNSVRKFSNVYNISTTAAQTGVLAIKLPVSYNYSMIAMKIKGYQYATNVGDWEVDLGGYCSNLASGWVNTSTQLNGKAPFTKVRFTHDTSDGNKLVILLGDTSTVWRYAQISITDLIVGFGASSAIDAYGSGWTHTISASEANYANIIFPTLKTPAMLSDTTSDFAGTISASNLSGTNTGDQDLTPYYKQGDFIQPNNAFGGEKLYNTKLDDALFKLNARYAVTCTVYLKSDDSFVRTVPQTEIANLFNGDYESRLAINAGEYAVLNINFANTTYFPGYPYGWFVYSHYSSRPTTITTKVYCNYAPQVVGWKTLSTSTHLQSGSAYIYKSYNGYYQISQMEVKFEAGDATDGWVVQMEMAMDRPSSTNPMPIVSKFSDDELYNRLSWVQDNATKAYIDEDGTSQFSNVNVVSTGYNGFRAYSYSDTAAPYNITYRARGTEASPSYPLSGDYIGISAWRGYNNGSFPYDLASMRVLATENHTNSSAATRMDFYTTPSGATINVLHMTLSPEGNLGLGRTVPLAKLDVVGTSQYYGLLLDNNSSDGASNRWRFGATGSSWAAGDNKLVITYESTTSTDTVLEFDGPTKNVKFGNNIIVGGTVDGRDVAADGATLDGLVAGPDLTWSTVTGTTQAVSVKNGYVANHASTRIVFTLPATAALGSRVRVSGIGAAGWRVGTPAGDNIIFGTTTSTTGTGGYIESTNQYDDVELICVVADTTWKVVSAVGTLTVI